MGRGTLGMDGSCRLRTGNARRPRLEGGRCRGAGAGGRRGTGSRVLRVPALCRLQVRSRRYGGNGAGRAGGRGLGARGGART